LLAVYQSLASYTGSAGEPDFAARVAALRKLELEVDLAYLVENIPDALLRALDGLGRIATIVRSMNAFSHPDHEEKSYADLNLNVQATLVIAAHEYKQVAVLHTAFGELPPILCHVGELNLIINAAHAISDNAAAGHGIGSITVRTWREAHEVVLSIADTGAGISEHVRDKIFDPFFTTKEVGRGTGQGLAIARGVVVDKHGGQISFETELGRGTTFFVRLPIDAELMGGSAAA
jgi:signal transduction histidine kinase